MNEYIADPGFFRQGLFSQAISNGESVVFLDPALHSTENIENQVQGIDSDAEISSTEQIKILKSTPNWELAFRTSGSGGEPKLFYKSKKQIFAEIDYLKKFLNEIHFIPKNIPLSKIIFLASIPLCHIYGFLWGYMLPLDMELQTKDCKSLSSIRNELLSHSNNFQHESPNEDICMIWIAVPSQLEALLDLMDPSQANLKNTLIIVSGSRMKRKSALDFQKKFATSIIEIYGSTETGGMGYRFPAENDLITIFDSVHAKIIDRRLAVSSPFLFSDLPRDKEGFFLTDDLGELDGREFSYQGRMGRIIKKKGKRIHLDMIENLLLEFASVKDAIVVEYKEEHVGAVIQGDIGKIEWESIPGILLPDNIIYTDNLPKLPNGKKDYQSARYLFHS